MSKDKKGFEQYAKRKRPSHITAWSFSRYNTWLGCPLKAKYKFVLGMKEPSGKAAERGDLIHKGIEAFLKTPKLRIDSMSSVEEIHKKSLKVIEKMRKLKAEAELEMAFRSDWKSTGWFAMDTWCRIKVDALAFLDKGRLAGVTDWKSGRFKGSSESYDLQCHLYGTGVFAKYPKVQEVEARLHFVDHGKDVVKMYTRKQFDEMKAGWEDRVKPMLADRRFAPNPSAACRWCYFSKSHGGPCKF